MRGEWIRYGIIGSLLVAGTAVLRVAAEPAPGNPPQTPPPDPAQIRFFETNIRPVLAEKCLGCHGPKSPMGGLRLDGREALIKGGGRGPAVIPGVPERSLLIGAVRRTQPGLKMPPGSPLSEQQMADLERWVRTGAPWPAEQAVGIARSGAGNGGTHWAFVPVRRPPQPKVKDTAWVRTPIDAFILAGLEAKGLKPSPPADPRTLIRRVTFDLTGLPPTPDEVEAFVRECAEEKALGRWSVGALGENRQNRKIASKATQQGQNARVHPPMYRPQVLNALTPQRPNAPTAYERLVDRLLASPRYGERWGRHWLDLARYSDSNGMDENVHYGNAWRYRDYVVAAFNHDKPYDQFIIEQLAGDLLPATGDLRERNERLIATGFLAIGPKVISEVDDRKMEMDAIDEQLDTTGRTFMGLTLGCARCHNHKFDPITQKDYYGLAGIFKSTKFMSVMKKPRMWFEHSLATEADLARQAAYQKQVAQQKEAIATVVARETERLKAEKAGSAPQKFPETAFSEAAREELKRLREELTKLEAAEPQMPAAMGVTEGTVADLPVHIRGDFLNLGEMVPRRFPVILAGQNQPPLSPKESGRLQLARWLADPAHPLTARVMVNRVWRWHFGRGLVGTTDNFGLLGEKPSHPELLDWLAATFVEGVGALGLTGVEGQAPNASTLQRSNAHPWSLKALHRLILLSSTYQQSSEPARNPQSVDPENRLLWRWGVQRLEAEEIRDALLSVSGMLDPTMGGTLLELKNREYFFDHTSKDKTQYGSHRRSLYLPVVRNNLYDGFQIFDFGDASVPSGDRPTTTVPPQALFMMNSDLVMDSSEALAKRLLARSEVDTPGKLRLLYLTAYGREPTARETARGESALARFEAAQSSGEPAARRLRAWSWYTQTVLAANEFIYLR